MKHYRKYKDMITIEFNQDFYELVFTLPNTPFNKELLRNLYGSTIVTGCHVKSIFKTNDFIVTSETIKKFLAITYLLK